METGRAALGMSIYDFTGALSNPPHFLGRFPDSAGYATTRDTLTNEARILVSQRGWEVWKMWVGRTGREIMSRLEVNDALACRPFSTAAPLVITVKAAPSLK